MTSLIFVYQCTEINIPCEENEELDSIIQRFCSHVQSNKENFIFICDDQIINEKITFNQIPPNQDNKKIIFVKDISNINKPRDIIMKPNLIICPTCKESASISMDGYKISISDCKNGHIFDKINIKDFNNTQLLNLSKILCDQCKSNNMGSVGVDNFYKCVQCNINLCPKCKTEHNQNHKIYIYTDKFYMCEEHGELFVSYCPNCKKNLCSLCEGKHKEHGIKKFSEIGNNYDKNKLNEQLVKLGNSINMMKINIKKIIDVCVKVVENCEILYNIKKEIYENIDDKYVNFQSINNQKFIYNEIDKDIEDIFKENKLDYQFSKLLKIYDKIENKKEFKDSITIKYKINKSDKQIKLFDIDFIKNNIDNCKILYDNNIYDLFEYIDTAKIKSNDILEIKLLGVENITNAYCMFYECTSLISLPDLYNWNTINLTNIQSMFFGCSSLQSLSDISKWNTENLNRIACLFSGCSALKSLPDISKWNTAKITAMMEIFADCCSLESLPDISKWNFNSVKDTQNMFRNCSSLKSLPDISKWNTNNVIHMSNMFKNCSALESLPDISKWNVNNVEDMDYMFENCSSLKTLPDISKWNVKDSISMEGMFSGCSSSLNIPEKFKINN